MGPPQLVKHDGLFFDLGGILMAIHHHTPKQRKTIQAARKRKKVKKSKRKKGK